ncbi:MAG: transposase [Gudongella sp.]|nr:transposase [Gudongella sp.]
MPRRPRKHSSTGYYHAMARGNSKENVFQNDNLKKMYIRTINEIASEEKVCLAAYCIMSNHVHLLLKADMESLIRFFRRVNISYASNYNLINDRIGHVFQDRFRSEPVEDDTYFMQVVRYIHNNPVKAGLVSSPGSYQWSSYNEYIGKASFILSKAQKKVVMEFFSNKISSFERFHKVRDFNVYLDTKEEQQEVMYEHAQLIIEEHFTKHGLDALDQLKKKKDLLEDIVNEIYEKTGLSTRNIAKLLDVGDMTVRGKLK